MWRGLLDEANGLPKGDAKQDGGKPQEDFMSAHAQCHNLTLTASQ
jgi:hypothetical protein